jgi:galactonate dehydratase
MSPTDMDRRAWVGTMLGAGALYGLDAVAAARTDAAQVGPKDKIKVTKIETFVLTSSWVFVKISTDAGIVGWGEMLKDDAKACAAGAMELTT